MDTMTYHESYGNLSTTTLRLIRKYNVSPADYDQILAGFGYDWTRPDEIVWKPVNDFIIAASYNTGSYRPSRYL